MAPCKCRCLERQAKGPRLLLTEEQKSRSPNEKEGADGAPRPILGQAMLWTPATRVRLHRRRAGGELRTRLPEVVVKEEKLHLSLQIQ